MPLSPEMIRLLDRFEPEKGKHTRLLTENLTGQRLLPSTEQELQHHLEKRAQRDIKKQQATTEVVANTHTQEHAKGEQAAHEAAMVAHLAKRAKEHILAIGATEAEAEAASHIASTTMNVEGGINIPIT
jgi:hypothetical protein